ncbi:MAG: hypothetical protein RLZZ387_569 [Chloroflexota bacterium]|jgi:signal peptidase I
MYHRPDRPSADELRPRPPHPQRYSPLRQLADVLQTVAQTALLLFIFTALIGRYEIHQTSMEPSFHEGQRVMVSQVGSVLPAWIVDRAHAAGSGAAPFDLQRGQVVVFHEDPRHRGDALIKRTIGLPGETISIREGVVYINGVRLDEPYAVGIFTDCEVFCELTLAPGEYFFMGDNRTVSRDSRSFGPVTADHVIGRVVLRFWPLDQLTYFP